MALSGSRNCWHLCPDCSGETLTRRSHFLLLLLEFCPFRTNFKNNLLKKKKKKKDSIFFPITYFGLSAVAVSVQLLFNYTSNSKNKNTHKLCLVCCKLEHLLAVILSSSFLAVCSVHVLDSGAHKMTCFFQRSHPTRTLMSWSLMSHQKVCGFRPTEHFLYSDNREKPTFTLYWNH